MRRYEYKVVRFSSQIGFDFDKKCRELEEQWNALGREGWRFCTNGNDCTIFVRELEND